MKIDDLAKVLGMSRFEVEEMLKKEDVISINLRESSSRQLNDNGKIEFL